jgi:hypothetical protein
MPILYIRTLIDIFLDGDSSVEEKSSVEMEHVFKSKSRSFPVISSSKDAITPVEGSSSLPFNLVEEIADSVINKLDASKKVGMSPENTYDFDNLERLPYTIQSLE